MLCIMRTQGVVQLTREGRQIFALRIFQASGCSICASPLGTGSIFQTKYEPEGQCCLEFLPDGLIMLNRKLKVCYFRVVSDCRNETTDRYFKRYPEGGKER
jgi:hypothetical protein